MARLARIEAELENEDGLVGARADANSARLELRAASDEGRATEDALAGQRRKLEETEAKLYGGQVQNPKTLEELQAEAEALRRHMATLEDRALEAMVRVEETEQVASAATTALELAEADAAGRSQTLLREKERVSGLLTQKSHEREAALTGIAPGDLRLYLSLRENTRGLAVALMQDGSCRACGLTLSASDRQEVSAGSALVRCGQCGRILYAG